MNFNVNGKKYDCEVVKVKMVPCYGTVQIEHFIMRVYISLPRESLFYHAVSPRRDPGV